MDLMNLLSLIFFGASIHGVSGLYQGKLEKSRDGMTQGIVEFCLGTIGFFLSTPIFSNTVFSVIAALCLSFVAIAYMAGVFVALKPWEEVWHVDAKLETNESFRHQRPAPALSESKKDNALVPFSFSNVSKALNYVRKK